MKAQRRLIPSPGNISKILAQPYEYPYSRCSVCYYPYLKREYCSFYSQERLCSQSDETIRLGTAIACQSI
jgi:hypothetical protein